MGLFTFTFVLGIRIQHGNSMYPFIVDGDVLITYKLDDYRVGDAVTFRHPETGEETVSRVVALGLNQINVTEQGEFLVNGYLLSTDVFYLTNRVEGSLMVWPYEMDEDSVFVLMDYRPGVKANKSGEGSRREEDSRVFGALKKEDLTGKVVYVFRRRGI